MPQILVNYRSESLQREFSFQVLLPAGPGPFPVVYQLHGLSDDHTAWARWTTIERIAAGLGLAVVLPNGERSWYSNRSPCERWEDHLGEVIDVAEGMFRCLRRDRAGRGIGGLSMGGYGALKLGLKQPGRFISVVSHSGAVDVEQYRASHEWLRPDLEAIWGRTPVPASDDLFAIARDAATRIAGLPAIHLDIGVDDFLIEDDRRFHRHLTTLGVPHAYTEHPGAHDWDYWQAHVAEGLAFHAKRFTAG